MTNQEKDSTVAQQVKPLPTMPAFHMGIGSNLSYYTYDPTPY